MYFYTGVIVVTTVLIFFSKTSTDIKLLSLMGLYILVTYPFSSSAGLFTVGIYSIWLSFPIVIDYLFKIRDITTDIPVLKKMVKDKSQVLVDGTQLNQIRNWTAIVCIFACLVYTWRYPFFDKHERLKMTSSINNKYLRGILTTHERATALNEMLEESAKYLSLIHI